MSNSENIELRNALEAVDAIAMAELDQIAMIARLALASMELPRTAKAMQLYATAFEAIAARASMLENDLSCITERVGCHSVDEDHAARNVALQQLDAARHRAD